MVSYRSRQSFLKEEAGISLVEGLIALPITMLVFAGFVEFGYAMFQWNQTVKALQYGARLAAVSDPVAANFDPTAVAAGGTGGTTIPAGAPGPWVCGPGKANCNVDRLNRIVVGTANRPGMQDLNPRIGPDNVVIRYELSGLGYYGRPTGAVTTIRLEVRNISFELPLIDGLFRYFCRLDPAKVASGECNAISGTVSIPPMPVTVTSEDLDTTI